MWTQGSVQARGVALAALFFCLKRTIGFSRLDCEALPAKLFFRAIKKPKTRSKYDPGENPEPKNVPAIFDKKFKSWTTVDISKETKLF